MELGAQFGDLTAKPSFLLDEAALLIAAHAYPELDMQAELRRLDELADGCPEPTLDGVLRQLFGRLGFRGNRADYYDPRNSLLNDVMERRLGIPISLAFSKGIRGCLTLADLPLPSSYWASPER